MESLLERFLGEFLGEFLEFWRVLYYGVHLCFADKTLMQTFYYTHTWNVPTQDILDVVNTHRRQNADITVVTRSVCRSDAERLGVVVVNQDSGLLQSFVEKPQDPILAELANTSSHTTAALPYEANQGVYVFRRDTLLELLADKDERTAHVQFGRDVLPAALSWGLTVAGRWGTGC